MTREPAVLAGYYKGSETYFCAVLSVGAVVVVVVRILGVVLG